MTNLPKDVREILDRLGYKKYHQHLDTCAKCRESNLKCQTGIRLLLERGAAEVSDE